MTCTYQVSKPCGRFERWGLIETLNLFVSGMHVWSDNLEQDSSNTESGFRKKIEMGSVQHRFQDITC